MDNVDHLQQAAGLSVQCVCTMELAKHQNKLILFFSLIIQVASSDRLHFKEATLQRSSVRLQQASSCVEIFVVTLPIQA